jgi:lipopolysaccharide/colanic/teichoic acid biosynthesis glycosyltransferase
MTRTQQVIKRAVDVIVSASALVVLLPLLPLVALLIKLDSPGPVFYVARRYGQNHRPFDFYKLRTMVPDADRLGSVILTKARDERVTRVGRILRAFKIDELPQLLNVLKGDMSIVGPRPEVFEVVENHYRDRWERILSVRPGLTCLLQVAVYPEFTIGHGGVADPIRYYIEQDLPLKIRLDTEYVDRASLALDFKIMGQTLYNILVKSWRFVGHSALAAPASQKSRDPGTP